MCSNDKRYACLFLYILITSKVLNIALSPLILEWISQVANTGEARPRERASTNLRHGVGSPNPHQVYEHASQSFVKSQSPGGKGFCDALRGRSLSYRDSPCVTVHHVWSRIKILSKWEKLRRWDKMERKRQEQVHLECEWAFGALLTIWRSAVFALSSLPVKSVEEPVVPTAPRH